MKSVETSARPFGTRGTYSGLEISQAHFINKGALPRMNLVASKAQQGYFCELTIMLHELTADDKVLSPESDISAVDTAKKIEAEGTVMRGYCGNPVTEYDGLAAEISLRRRCGKLFGSLSLHMCITGVCEYSPGCTSDIGDISSALELPDEWINSPEAVDTYLFFLRQ